MNKKLLQLGLLTGLLFTSCQKDDNTPEEIQESKFQTTTSTDELSNAIKFDETGVIGVSSVNQNRAQEPAWIFGIEQIAFLAPPEINSQALRATHVDVKGNYAYVSYNKEGAIYLGAIDIVDVSDQYHPVLVSRMKTDFADINSLYIDDNDNLIFTGASMNGEGPNHTLLGYVETQHGKFSSDFKFDYGLAGHTGVDVLNYNGNTVLISGNEGVVGSYNLGGSEAAFLENAQISYGDLRSAACNDSNLAVLSGDDGLLDLGLNSDTFSEVSKIETAAMTPESKRTITWYGENVLVSEGTEGAGIYNFNVGARVSSLPLKMHPDATLISPEDKVTNAVSTDNNFIYMANGGAGLDILKLDENLNTIAEGIAEINGSANFVQAKGDYIYLASGTGLRILKIITPQQVANDFLDCDSYASYTGDKNLNINTNESASYAGVLNLKHLNVGGILNVCGSVILEKSANINSGGNVNVAGDFYLGNSKNTENLVINSQSKFKMKGKMEIFGDLIVNSGGLLEFVGEDSEIYVHGEVKINSGGEITGEYKDLSDKFN